MGKELDAQHFQPQIEAEKEKRARSRDNGFGQTRANARSRNGQGVATADHQAAADVGWDHAQDVADAGERPARSSVPRSGSRQQSRINRAPSGPTRSGP
ncbi:MAG: hypothetical protein AAGH43_10065 [Pseudomonadota bacterium]